MRISSKYIGFITILVLVVLVSGCISNDEIINNNISHNSSVNMSVKSYSTDDFSFQYPSNWHLISYDENSSDIEISKDPYILMFMPNFIFQLSPSPYSPRFQIQIMQNSEILNPGDPFYATLENSGGISIPNNFVTDNVSEGNFSNLKDISTNYNLSEQQIIDMMRNDTDIFGTRISNDTIQIDGETAYEDVFVFNSVFPPMIDRKFVHIIFVKNDKTYLMVFEAQNCDFDKEKKNFDIILNSFKMN